MAHRFTLRRRVEFYETDMAGIVHFANFFKYMEACEHAFVRSLGHSAHPGEGFRPGMPDASTANGDDGVIGWPRVHAECDYRQPLRYDEEFEIRLLVREKREKAIHYDFLFHRPGEAKPLARGRMVAVCVGRVGGQVRGIPIPSSFADQIEAAPDALLAEQDGAAADGPSSKEIR